MCDEIPWNSQSCRWPVLWSAGPLVLWSSGPLVPWSSGPSWIRYVFCKANKEASKQGSKQASTSCSPLDLVCCWGGRCAPPQPPRARKSALHPRHPRLPRNQYFKVNSPVQNFLTKQICLLYLSMYLSIHLFFYLSICSSTSTKYYTYTSTSKTPAPATKSALQGPQSPAPATNSTLLHPHQKLHCYCYLEYCFFESVNTFY